MCIYIYTHTRARAHILLYRLFQIPLEYRVGNYRNDEPVPDTLYLFQKYFQLCNPKICVQNHSFPIELYRNALSMISQF